MRDAVLEAFKQVVYFTHQVHWLHSRFPEGRFVDVPGLCRAAPVGDEETRPDEYCRQRLVAYAGALCRCCAG